VTSWNVKTNPTSPRGVSRLATLIPSSISRLRRRKGILDTRAAAAEPRATEQLRELRRQLQHTVAIAAAPALALMP
jgi:hypothetical protein